MHNQKQTNPDFVHRSLKKMRQERDFNKENSNHTSLFQQTKTAQNSNQFFLFSSLNRVGVIPLICLKEVLKEKIHGDRFGKLAELLKTGAYFECQEGEKWMCLNCGHIHSGLKVPGVCPVCRHERGYFIPVSLAPYLMECE